MLSFQYLNQKIAMTNLYFQNHSYFYALIHYPITVLFVNFEYFAVKAKSFDHFIESNFFFIAHTIIDFEHYKLCFIDFVKTFDFIFCSIILDLIHQFLIKKNHFFQ